MRTSRSSFCSLAVLAASLVGSHVYAADHFVSLTGGHVLPFTNWADAATNIQDAIDAAAAGETVWVTNGVYATGGKVMAGDLANRVALDKALTVQSLNGPNVTSIQGAWDPVLTNGPLAVRCAWLMNSSVLNGFTLRGGATRPPSNPSGPHQYGGGVWGESTNATVVNCYITNNAAGFGGGGAMQVALKNCYVAGNTVNFANYVWNVSGGGALNCWVQNCVIRRNTAQGISVSGGGIANCFAQNSFIVENQIGASFGAADGGGVASSRLINCTVTRNTANNSGIAHGGGVYGASLTNCIVFLNQATTVDPVSSSSNYFSSTFAYSCTAPATAGVGNILANPQLLVDSLHLATNSPCRGAGTNSVISGADIDGQLWNNPPDIGCDAWQPVPQQIVSAQPAGVSPGVIKLGGAVAAGAEPLVYIWMKDGAPLIGGPRYNSVNASNLVVYGLDPADAGGYQVVFSNSFGMATSAVAQVVVRCVDGANSSPVPPFSTWATAAATIQSAIDASSDGDFVLVTNGVYSSGGKAMSGDLTNRVAVDKAITVMSVKGPSVTMIQGAWDPVSTNGPLAVRCAWLTDNATLMGFTIQGGATRTNGGFGLMQGGGGAYAESWLATLANCIIVSNVANSAGGGVFDAKVVNSLVRDNTSYSYGGGAYGCLLMNSTVVGNSARLQGGGVYDAYFAMNCIISSNNSALGASVANYYYSSPVPGFTYSCATPFRSGAGNISSDPQLLDSIHLAITSPCRGAGTNIADGTDIDGEAWTNPPSMGCDEVWETGITGSLAVAASALWPAVAERGSLPLNGQVTGWASRLGWDYGDGSILTNASLLSTSHVWTNAGDYTVMFTAFNADNTNGVSTNLVVHVVPLEAPTISVGGLSGTNFSLSFPGQPGVTYVVQQATNLAAPVTWQTVSTISSTGSVMQITDKKATNDMRFYRVKGP